mgnify:CR=1 FL=1
MRVVQAEDEIAAIGMVLGASWAGARAMTTTSGPGLSLMTEFTGYAYYAEIPAVIWDIQRIGPSTGLPTRTSQADLLSVGVPLARRHEARDALPRHRARTATSSGCEAFDLAERLQTPVFVMSDLDLGSERRGCPTRSAIPKSRGTGARSSNAADPDDGSGRSSGTRTSTATRFPTVTLPGTAAPAGGLLHARLRPRRAGADTPRRPRPTRVSWTGSGASGRPRGSSCRHRSWTQARGAEVGTIAFGSTHHAMGEARDPLARRALATSYLLVKAYPVLEGGAAGFVETHERIYVVEQNRDAQMAVSSQDGVSPIWRRASRSILQYDGLPIDAQSVIDGLRSGERMEVVAR